MDPKILTTAVTNIPKGARIRKYEDMAQQRESGSVKNEI